MSGWRARAACAGQTDLFFADASRDRGKDGPVDRAKQVCAACPVKRECRAAYAALSPDLQRHGVWWGTSPQDRGLGTRRHRSTA